MLSFIRELSRLPLRLSRLEAEIAALKAGQTRYIVEAEDLLNKLVAMEARWRQRQYRESARIAQEPRSAAEPTNGAMTPADRALLARKGF